MYAGDQIIENVTTKRFFFQDSLGNTSHLSDEAGNLLEFYTCSAFGQPKFYNAAGSPSTVSTQGTKHLFQGQLWTWQTWLNDYRNRVELPSMGVFMQPDPIGFKGDAANIYRFCSNNAVNRTDPMGLVDTGAIKLYSRLTSFDGGDWIKGSDGLSALDWNDKRLQAGMDGGITMGLVEGSTNERSTPIPNPRSKASAEVVWAGETAVDNSMSRSQIASRWGGDGAATTANYPDSRVEMDNGKAKIIQPVTATKHLPNNVSQREYAHLNAIETKSVGCIQNSVGNASIRLSRLVNDMSDANLARTTVTQSIKNIMLNESAECRARADMMGGNANP